MGERSKDWYRQITLMKNSRARPFMLARKYSDGVEILSIDKDELMKNLTKCARRIKRDHPSVARILLYGSFMRNNFTPNSDVDIAIIVNHTNESFIARQDNYITYLSTIPLDISIVVYTIEEIKKLKREKNGFIQEVLCGIELGRD